MQVCKYLDLKERGLGKENDLLASFLFFSVASSTPQPAISTASLTTSSPVNSCSAFFIEARHSCQKFSTESGISFLTLVINISSHRPGDVSVKCLGKYRYNARQLRGVCSVLSWTNSPIVFEVRKALKASQVRG